MICCTGVKMIIVGLDSMGLDILGLIH